MYSFPIGVMLDSFRTDVPTALGKAAKVGASGIQVYSTYGELSPEKLVGSKRGEFLDMVKSHGLKISALCGDFGHGFGDPDKNPDLIEKSKRVLDLAKELETDVVTTHIGVVPTDSCHPRYQIMQDACGKLAEYADQMDAHFAIETGPETAATLKGFLDGLHSTGVAVNLDPANLVMVTGDDPVAAVYTLKDYIVHTHAKDGRRLLVRDPEIIYGIIEDEIQAGRAFIELPLGEGDVDFPNYLKALDDIGYRGFLTIEREVGDDPETDIAKAVTFLQDKIKGE
ncbi:sugar phosphate isomerase/epimerase family protein [Bianquea renquensis]|jgi:AP endonuclease, family 2|uniref:Sugar phosphate isomerase/epimerase n=1 Tax=Bianquea renquensis TaxID=2763661 RepID=A0A926DRP3_9FIRM|nr:sugar phosphate isomerase/epimerase family protein [Bianquea renquensis]MBC8544000.1 sugar phosphate isomerase/epimerase [Bianquea renquensis]